MDSSLHNACKYNDVQLVEYLLSHPLFDTYLLDALNFDGLSPLHIAVERKYLDIIKMLLNRGANIEILDGNDFSPLHYSIVVDELDSTKCLLDNNAKLIWNDSVIELYLLHNDTEPCNMTSLILIYMLKQNMDKFNDITEIYGQKYNKQLESIKFMMNKYVYLGPHDKINYFEFIFADASNFNIEYFSYKIDANELEIDAYHMHLFYGKYNELNELKNQKMNV